MCSTDGAYLLTGVRTIAFCRWFRRRRWRHSEACVCVVPRRRHSPTIPFDDPPALSGGTFSRSGWVGGRPVDIAECACRGLRPPAPHHAVRTEKTPGPSPPPVACAWDAATIPRTHTPRTPHSRPGYSSSAEHRGSGFGNGGGGRGLRISFPVVMFAENSRWLQRMRGW